MSNLNTAKLLIQADLDHARNVLNLWSHQVIELERACEQLEAVGTSRDALGIEYRGSEDQAALVSGKPFAKDAARLRFRRLRYQQLKVHSEDAMCVNYLPVSKKTLVEAFHAPMSSDAAWPEEAYQDYLAPLIRHNGHGGRESLLGSYGMVPKQHIPQGIKRFSTLNARAETVGQLRSYSGAWKRCDLCLLPMDAFYEPNWETGEHIRYRIGMADKSPFAVAGLYRQWEESDGQRSFSFTQLTVNADEHSLMNKMHRIDDEKRSLVIVPPEDYDAWLACRNPEEARSFLRLFPAELMAARPEPKAQKQKKPTVCKPEPTTRDLF